MLGGIHSGLLLDSPIALRFRFYRSHTYHRVWVTLWVAKITYKKIQSNQQFELKLSRPQAGFFAPARQASPP